MQRKPSRETRALSILSIAISSILAGCGGGGGGGSSTPPQQPAPPAPIPPPAVTPGDTVGLTSSNRIVTFNRAAAAVRTGVAITGLQAGEDVVSVDVRPGGSPAGELYALTNAGRIYTLNSTTGAATLKTTLAADAGDSTNPFAALDGAEFGADFNPTADLLRVVSNTGQNLRVNVDTGATTTDSAVNTGGTARLGVSGVAYSNSFSDACRSTLYMLDTSTDQLVASTDAIGGLVTDVGSLGVDADGLNGYEIATAADGTNSGLAVLTVGGAPTLYTIDLSTGAATSVAAVTGLNAGETLRGIAAAPPATAPAQAAGNVLAVTESNRLITFTNAAPNKLCTSAAITGLQAAENVLGIDRRPSNGLFYIVGSSGRIYSIDTAGVATQTAVLVPELTDVTDPFTGISGTVFGVDFTSVLNRMRLVSDTGQNLRINVDSGATITDTLLNPVGPTASGLANSNSFAGALSTLTYVIDSANDSLMLLGRPSGNSALGDLAAVGLLGLGDVQGGTGFDIVGTDNTAFLAVNLAGAATSDFSSVNLTTGAATRINTIGGGERVRELAFVEGPLVTALGVTADNRVIGLSTATPGKLDINVGISGLQGGEKIISAELDGSGEMLNAVSDSGRRYRIDPATGKAEVVGDTRN